MLRFNFDNNRVGLQFGRFFHKRIFPPVSEKKKYSDLVFVAWSSATAEFLVVRSNPARV
jgi:hypothetical protein